MVFFIFYQNRKSGSVWKHILVSASLTFVSLFPFWVWTSHLASLGKTPEYSVSLEKIIALGFNFSIPTQMILGMFKTDQSLAGAYAYCMIASILLMLLKQSQRVLAAASVVVFLYWGLVYGLYATLWQKGDLSSAGRYFSHGAFALILLVPLAFLNGTARHSKNIVSEST